MLKKEEVCVSLLYLYFYMVRDGEDIHMPNERSSGNQQNSDTEGSHDYQSKIEKIRSSDFHVYTIVLKEEQDKSAPVKSTYETILSIQKEVNEQFSASANTIEQLARAAHTIIDQYKLPEFDLSSAKFESNGMTFYEKGSERKLARIYEGKQSYILDFEGKPYTLSKGTILINPKQSYEELRPATNMLDLRTQASIHLFSQAITNNKLFPSFIAMISSLGSQISTISTLLASILPQQEQAKHQMPLNIPRMSKKEYAVGIVVRIEIDEEPLTAHLLGTLFTALTTLATKYWLIEQKRFSDLIEFTRSHDARFLSESNAIITRLSYNSPFNFDFKLSATDVAQAVATTVDGIMQGKERLRQMEIETQEKEQALKQAKQIFEEERETYRRQQSIEEEIQQLEMARKRMEIEKMQLDVERERLQITEARIQAQYQSLNQAIIISQTAINCLIPNADEATKQMMTQACVNDILQLNNVSFTSITILDERQACTPHTSSDNIPPEVPNHPSDNPA